MDVSPVLVADLQAPEAVEPGERPFDHPPVASQAVLGLDTTAADAGDDGPDGGDGSRNPCRHGACAVGDGARRVLARMGSMASTVSSIIFATCTFAALTTNASGMPWTSTTRWRFERGTLWVPPRYVRFLPVSWLPGAGTAPEPSTVRSDTRAARPWASATPAGAAARPAPTTHPATVRSPWRPPTWLPLCFLGCLHDTFVRRT